MHRAQLPPPLPPETRTVGQLVAESLKLYAARFWPSLALGIGPAVVGVADAELDPAPTSQMKAAAEPGPRAGAARPAGVQVIGRATTTNSVIDTVSHAWDSSFRCCPRMRRRRRT